MKDDIVPLQFEGDTILITQKDGKVWATIKPLCEALGLQAHPQAEKLKEKPWAVTRMIRATGSDGKTYDMLALDLDSVPMWLVTIDPSRVSDEVKPKLVKYQLRLKQFISDHVFGTAERASKLEQAWDLVKELLHGGYITKAQALATMDFEIKEELGYDFSGVLGDTKPDVPLGVWLSL